MNTFNNFPSIEQMTHKLNSTEFSKIKPSDNKSGVNFQQILDDKKIDRKNSDSVVFSKHANERLEDRKIKLSAEQLERLNEGTRIAYEKGIKESLVMIDEYSFIVNVKNNTVITAVGENEKKVFTNIDGAVIV